MKAADIFGRLIGSANEKVGVYPCNNLRASSIGEQCERKLVLGITNWEDAEPHSASLQQIFDLGNALEGEVIRRIKEAGFEVLTGRKNFKINKPLISGREDIRIACPETGELYPCEIKCISPYTWDSINSVADMLNHKYPHVRKYPAQLQIYMYHFNKENGFFFLLNKVSGKIKVIESILDYDYVESLLQKAERVYKHIAAGTLPDTMEDSTNCTDCPFLIVCGQAINRGEVSIDTGELEDLLQRREELLPVARELEEVKKQITSTIGDADMIFTRSYMVEIKTVHRKAYKVEACDYRKSTIKRIC